MDQLVAMMSRAFPPPETEAQKKEGDHHVQHFIKNNPELALSIFRPGASRPLEIRGQKAWATLLGEGHRLNRAMDAFSARVGLALYRATFGKAVPSNGIARAAWASNVDMDGLQGLDETLVRLGAPGSLHMGKKHVAGQFRYWIAHTPEDETRFACVAAFREAFGSICVIDLGVDATDRDGFRPGFLNGFEL